MYKIGQRRQTRIDFREGEWIHCYTAHIHYLTLSETAVLVPEKERENRADLVPVQVKSCNLCIVSLKVREVVEVIIGFLIPLLPAGGRQSHATIHRTIKMMTFWQPPQYLLNLSLPLLCKDIGPLSFKTAQKACHRPVFHLICSDVSSTLYDSLHGFKHGLSIVWKWHHQLQLRPSRLLHWKTIAGRSP